MRELETRLVPWESIEVTHARNRPAAERPPLPRIGDRVFYRHNDWAPDVQLVTVLDLQPVDDLTLVDYDPDVGPTRDPNLWHLVRDHNGRPVMGGGEVRYARVADPWPWVMFRRHQDSDRITQAREARLRGSAGWLPLDWETRPERWRLPAQTRLAKRPALVPLNVPRTPIRRRG